MQFKEIIGHEDIKRRLRETVRQGRISHALLFTGGEGAGALPLALAYAQYVNCRNRTEEDSCGVCPECYRMQRMEHPDCHYIYPVNVSKEAVATGRADEKPRSEQFVHVWRRAVPQRGVSHRTGVVRRTGNREPAGDHQQDGRQRAGTEDGFQVVRGGV